MSLKIKEKIKKIVSNFNIFLIKVFPRKPTEWENAWTTLYFGARGSGKSLHQADLTIKTLDYLTDLYLRYPNLKKAIIFTNQTLNKKYQEKYKDFLYHWDNFSETKYCPRKNCWRGKQRHRLHGCYLIFDDIAAILPADAWQNLPIWARKNFSQARHFGIRIIANCQDPFSVDINFRRYVDLCVRFKKIIGSRDPDETKLPIKTIWGLYLCRRIPANILWKMGDMTDEEIDYMREIANKDERAKKLYGKLWIGSIHLINKYKAEIYDTTQDVAEFKPQGFMHYEITCNDPEHPNCGHKKIIHELY